MSESANRLPAALALSVAVFGWSASPVLIRFLSDAYDPYTQAFVRYTCGSLVLVAICLRWYRKEFLAVLLHPGGLTGMALANWLGQITWTISCYGSEATVAQLLTKLTVIFVIILGYVLFHEERAVIRSPLYLGGTTLSLVGVAAVLAKKPGSLVPEVDMYTLLLIITALLWAIYAVWGKHLTKTISPLPMFTVVAVYTTIGLAFVMAAVGSPARSFGIGPMTAIITVISGILPISASHVSFHFAQKYLGAAFSTSVTLVNPFLTFLLAMVMLPGEGLTLTQWIGACVLIAGTAAVLNAGRRVRAAQRLKAARYSAYDSRSPDATRSG